MEGLPTDLIKLESLLKCPICYNFYETAMFLPECSHTYCSLCIRKSLTYKSECPTCRKPADSTSLQNNRLVDQCVLAFQPISNKIHASETKPKDKTQTSTTGAIVCVNILILDSLKSECPICHLHINHNHINDHLDTCINKDETRDSFFEQNKDKVITTTKQKHLPKYVYNLLSDKKIKDLLKIYNLSTKGDRQTLISRHREFVIRYNSECDKLSPKTAQEIVKEMTETEQNIQKSSLNKRSIKANDKEFSSLIQEVKQRKRKSPKKEEESAKKQFVETVVIDDL